MTRSRIPATSGWLLPALALATVLGGCGGSGAGIAPQEIRYRALHFVSNATSVVARIDGSLAGSVEYGQGASVSLTADRAYDFSFELALPTGAVQVIDLQDRANPGGTEYTVVALGLDGAPANGTPVTAVEFTDPIDIVPTGQFRLRLLHALPSLPSLPNPATVDIYVTAPDAAIDAGPVQQTLSYGQFTADRTLLPAGNYRVRITPAGQPGTVVFDSGSQEFGAGRNYLVGVVPNTGLGSAPVALVRDNGTGQSFLLDQSTTALVRALHYSPDAAPIKVNAISPAGDRCPASGVTETDITADFSPGLPPLGSTGYEPLAAPAIYRFAVTEGAPAACPDPPATAPAPLVSADRLVLPGSRLTLVLAGKKSDTSPTSTLRLQLFPIFESIRPINRVAQIRFINVSTTAPSLDFYVSKQGTPLPAAPLVRGTLPGTATAVYAQLEPDSYIIRVTEGGTVVEVGSLELPLGNASVTTVLTRDSNDGGRPIVVDAQNDLD